MSASTHQKVLGVAIAGLGRLGQRHAIQLARRTPNAQLVAVCSPVPTELEWARDTLAVDGRYDALSELLVDPLVDAVILATPTSLHADQAIACLRAGKHVFVEKPLSLDVAACEAVEAVARDCPDQVIMVGFVRRFDASYLEAKAAIDCGDIGTPFWVRSQTCDRYDPDGFFVGFAATSGGIFMDCAVHDIDLARWFLGNPKAVRVFATGMIAMYPDLAVHGDVDNGLAVVEFDGGQHAVFYVSRTMPHGHETTTEVIGSGGTLQIGMGAHASRVAYRHSSGVSHRVVPDFFARFEQAFQTELVAFVDACRGVRPVSLTLRDATEATRIGQAIALSLTTGVPVNL